MHPDRRAGRGGYRLRNEGDAEPGVDQFADAAGAVCFEPDVGTKPGAVCRGVEQRPQPAVGREADERLVPQVGEADAVHSSQSVRGRADHDEALAGERPGDVSPGQSRVDRSDNKVELGGVEPLQ